MSNTPPLMGSWNGDREASPPPTTIQGALSLAFPVNSTLVEQGPFLLQASVSFSEKWAP